jgi:hypothetical protein
MSENERAHDIDAAWRNASREEPASALDDAIRAEARRAVDAAPGGASPRRAWRYPAAAAATVALLAFGIAQMTPREEIEPTVVSDQPSAPAATPEPMRPPARAMEPAPRQEQNAAADRFAAAPPPAAMQPANKSAASAAAPDARAKLATNAATAPAPAAGPPHAVASQPAESAAREARRDDAPRDAYAAMQKRAASAPGATSNMQSQVMAAPQAPPAGRLSDGDDARAKDAGEQSVAAWIARIRELQQNGQADAATRELARFRTTYGARANALLPPDLRTVATSDAKGQ